jgi:hypothetical protein
VIAGDLLQVDFDTPVRCPLKELKETIRRLEAANAENAGISMDATIDRIYICRFADGPRGGIILTRGGPAAVSKARTPRQPRSDR